MSDGSAALNGGAPPGVARGALAAGPLCWAVLHLIPAPGTMPPLAWAALGVLLWMGTWWVTDAVPLPITAVLPLILFPVLGVLSPVATATPYANPVVFLFLGGFLIAKGVERSGLHRRIAFAILSTVGASPSALIGGFMAATALIGMWVSNTATVMMMYPMALAVIGLAERDAEAVHPQFATALLLSLVYASGIGGVATLIGSPPNAIVAGLLAESVGRPIGFAQWMLLGMPVALVGVPLAWLITTRVLFRVGSAPIAGGDALIKSERRALGRASGGEWTVGVLVLLIASAWVLRPFVAAELPGVTDASISLTGALLLFVVPAGSRRAGPMLRGADLEAIPWPVLLLFGGGLALGEGITASGLAAWIGTALGATGAWPPLLVSVLLIGGMLFFTEFASNTASASIFLPIVIGLAMTMGVTPELFAVPVALAASFAFMLPVATPPAAIVYASGRVTIRQMAFAGLWINLLMFVVLTVATMTIVGPIFGRP